MSGAPQTTPTPPPKKTKKQNKKKQGCVSLNTMFQNIFSFSAALLKTQLVQFIIPLYHRQYVSNNYCM